MCAGVSAGTAFTLYCRVGCSKSNASYLFPRKLQQIRRVQWHCLIEQTLSYDTLFFSTVTTIS